MPKGRVSAPTKLYRSAARTISARCLLIRLARLLGSRSAVSSWISDEHDAPSDELMKTKTGVVVCTELMRSLTFRSAALEDAYGCPAPFKS